MKCSFSLQLKPCYKINDHSKKYDIPGLGTCFGFKGCVQPPIIVSSLGFWTKCMVSICGMVGPFRGHPLNHGRGYNDKSVLENFHVAKLGSSMDVVGWWSEWNLKLEFILPYITIWYGPTIGLLLCYITLALGCSHIFTIAVPWFHCWTLQGGEL